MALDPAVLKLSPPPEGPAEVIACAQRHDGNRGLRLQVKLVDDFEDPSNGPVAAAGQDTQPRPHQRCMVVALLLCALQVVPDHTQDAVRAVL
jgi:hypothetical protein